jgi:hypothetical protein
LLACSFACMVAMHWPWFLNPRTSHAPFLQWSCVAAVTPQLHVQSLVPASYSRKTPYMSVFLTTHEAVPGMEVRSRVIELFFR